MHPNFAALLVNDDSRCLEHQPLVCTKITRGVFTRDAVIHVHLAIHHAPVRSANSNSHSLSLNVMNLVPSLHSCSSACSSAPPANDFHRPPTLHLCTYVCMYGSVALPSTHQTHTTSRAVWPRDRPACKINRYFGDHKLLVKRPGAAAPVPKRTSGIGTLLVSTLNDCPL